jgi:hypothetical protein
MVAHKTYEARFLRFFKVNEAVKLRYKTAPRTRVLNCFYKTINGQIIVFLRCFAL